jgi:hydrogenase-4 component F
LTKAMLFLVAGNILTIMHSKSTADIKGLSKIVPITSALWLAGFFAITGSPPFGTFLSEFAILKATLEQGHTFIAIGFLLILAVIFVSMASIVLRMCQGQPSDFQGDKSCRELWPMVLPPLVLGIIVMILGVYVPPFLQNLLENAAKQLGSLA